jgi:LysM domain
MFGPTLDPERLFAHDAAMERTYVRRRRTVAALAISVFLGLGWIAMVGRPGTAGPNEGFRPLAMQRYVVRPGDTTWSIAVRVAGSRDPRDVVQRIQSDNDVDVARLVPGQVLFVPSLAVG